MKRFGIVTMHRPRNVGCGLQAFALQDSIRRLGHECQIIDYVYPNRLHGQTTAKRRLLRGGNAVLKAVIGGGAFRRRDERFDRFTSERLNLTASYRTAEALEEAPPYFDAYVAGSDQIWRPSYIRNDATFFCGFAPEGRRVVSYGSSFGVSEIGPEVEMAYRRHLERFSMVSIREDDGVRIAERLYAGKVVQVLDPTLILERGDWESVSAPVDTGDPYILVYGETYSRSYSALLAGEIARRTGWRIVWLYGRPWQRFSAGVEYVFDAGPLESLEWVRRAEFVIAQSLHGTIFPIVFERPFYSVHNASVNLDTRQRSLLDCVGMSDRGLEVWRGLPEELVLEADFGRAREIVRDLRQRSISYLKAALGG